MNMTGRKPFSPGDILLEEFMQPYGLTQEDLANRIHVARRRINEIINGKRSITPDTALRLAKLFKVSPEFWLNLQAKYDIRIELHNKKIMHALKNIKAMTKRAA